jgi:hypothetical protein
LLQNSSPGRICSTAIRSNKPRDRPAGPPTAEPVPDAEDGSRPLLFPNLAIQNYKRARRIKIHPLSLFNFEQDESEQVVAREVGYRADSAFAWVR